MNNDPQACLMGVDGGGSRCRIALSCGGRRYDAEVGGANVSTDFDTAIDEIKRGLSTVARQAGLSSLENCQAYLGLAGVKGASDAERVAGALPFAKATVEDDRRSTLIGALGGHDGAVAGIGTGSFVACKASGAVRLLGGWGLALGDEASGAWLGRGLLAAVLKTADGLTRPSGLTRAILAEHDGEPQSIVAFSLSARPHDYAALAPRVIEAAAAGDAVATALMQAGAAYIQKALQAAGWSPGLALCLVGGVGPHYAAYLPEGIAQALVRPQGTALDGALRLAAGLEAGQ